MENIAIARILTDVADLLEIQGEINPFRIRAYRNAVHTVQEQGLSLRKLVEDGEDLTELPFIGKDMSRHITELVQTGKLTVLEEIEAQVPRSLIELKRLPGVGPKRTRRLWEELGVTTVDELEVAASEGLVEELDGFGKKTQDRILEGIERSRKRLGRFRLGDADQYVEPLLEYLRGEPAVQRVEVAGSYRRRKETVGDIDLLVIADDPDPVMERFASYPQVADVDKAGGTRGTVHLASGLQVDLRILTAEDYGAAMVYFTGSKEHNITLRQRALERGLSISEYGVFRLADDGDDDSEVSTTGRQLGERVAGRTEEDVYEAVDLPWIPPELREERGEFALADGGGLPTVLELSEIRGDLHMHSTWSDGKNSIEEMLNACAERGYEYFAMADHSKALAMTGGMDAAKLRLQLEEIEEIVGRRSEIKFLRSMEVDILADGSLDLEDEALELLDLVVISVHSRFALPQAKQTERLVRAVQHPLANILGHPTGRIINRRDAFDVDLSAVLECAAENKVAVELNANPARLDLKDTDLMQAKRLGAKVVINTDAHRISDLDLMHYGVEQARRAWLSADDVVNAWPMQDMLAYF
ncbi:MAG: DNA polymerase/3'-5' exonuclease PolX [Gemmatimonadota bacterium]